MEKITTSSAHTPGPWLVSRSENAAVYDGEPHLMIVDQTTHTAVADIEINPETEANARLIAAAPMLLKALKGMVDEIGMEELFEHDLENCGPETCTFCEAQAAIDAAGG